MCSHDLSACRKQWSVRKITLGRILFDFFIVSFNIIPMYNVRGSRILAKLTSRQRAKLHYIQDRRWAGAANGKYYYQFLHYFKKVLGVLFIFFDDPIDEISRAELG